MADQAKKDAYITATGRRKTAVARVRLSQGKTGSFVVNEKALDQYFQEAQEQRVATESLDKGAPEGAFSVSVIVKGGGIKAQAEAVRQGIARALVRMNPDWRASLKALGYLTRDPRMRERKKFGLKRARRARQWRKR